MTPKRIDRLRPPVHQEIPGPGHPSAVCTATDRIVGRRAASTIAPASVAVRQGQCEDEGVEASGECKGEELSEQQLVIICGGRSPMDRLPKRDRTGLGTTASDPEGMNVAGEATNNSRQLLASGLDSLRDPADAVVQRSVVVVESE